MNCCSPVHLHYGLGPWAFWIDTGQRTRAFVLAAGFLNLVDRLTELTRLTNAMRALSATRRGIFTNTVTMPLFRQDPFNFNVEISVSRGICRYHDVAGFRPRVLQIAPGSPAAFWRLIAFCHPPANLHPCWSSRISASKADMVKMLSHYRSATRKRGLANAIVYRK